MEKLNLIVIGDNDIATICIEEAYNAGHDVVHLTNSEEIHALSSSNEEVLIYVQANYRPFVNASQSLSLSFNDDLLLDHTTNICWFMAESQELFKPIKQDLFLNDNPEEQIRESFLEIISHLARGTRPFLHPCSEISGDSFAFNEHHLYPAFLKIVALYPTNLALIHEDNSLTYEQLAKNVKKQAAHLPSTEKKLIALYFKRNIQLITALLAVLKQDMAYVPLDPKNPYERNQAILNDAEVDIVLCDNETFLTASQFTHIKCINVDEILATNSLNTDNEIYNNPVAYVTYTSGSTGKPKGVLCTHHGALNMVLWTQATYPIKPSDRIFQLASYAFDISVWEIFSALLSGATLVLAKDDGYSDPNYIADSIAKYGITLAHMIPSILNLFLDRIHLPSTLSQVVSGGEELRPNVAQQFFNKLPSAKLYHGYGPTECAITCIHHHVAKEIDNKFIPIGFPISNTTLYVVDQAHRLVTVGKEGEALIAGAGIAKGYLNNSDETSQKFIAGKIYKTGDRVTLLSDNTVQFCGRLDQQLKIRGNRIELEEIERVIQAHPDVKSCALLPVQDKETFLVGFCTLQNEDKLAELVPYLRTKLPSYMIPAQLLHMVDLPRTVNGKIDKIALLNQYENQVAMQPIISEVYNEIEAKLITYVHEELHFNVKTLDEELVSLGFHSLAFIYLINFIERTYQIKLSPRDVFQAGNLRQVAELVSKYQAEMISLIGNHIVPVSRHATLPLSNAQSRLWFLHQLENQASAAYNILKIYDLGVKIDIKRLSHALTQLIERHEILRTLFKSVNGRPHQVITNPYAICLEPIAISEKDFQSTLIEFGQHHFNLAEDKLIRVVLFYVNETGCYILAILQHNIITDGWSAGIILKEINYFYNLPTKTLPRPDLQYADFAVWQNQRLIRTNLDQDLLYWQETLSKHVPLNFPLDKPRPLRTTTNGATLSLTLPYSDIKSVFNFIQQNNVTLYTYLITVLAIVLSRYANQSDVMIGTGYAGRDKDKLSNMLGFFVNTLPLRIQFQNDMSFVDALKKSQQIILDALSHSEIPFDILIDKLRIEREPHISPLFQILFLMQDAADNIHLTLDEQTANELTVDLGVSIYDITFNVLKSEKGICLSAQYNTDIFIEKSIAQLLEHYAKAITDFVSHPNQTIQTVELLTDYDVQHYSAFYPEDNYYSSYQSILDIWHKTKQHHHDQIALLNLIDNQNLSYEAMDHLSDKIARALYHHFGSNNVIAIYLPKSIPFFITMLGIIKSGNTYLIIDIDMPIERIQYILRDSSTRGIIGHSPDTAFLTELFVSYEELIASEIDMELPQKQNETVYILYTSGSTGKPKGVRISQQNLLNTLEFFTNHFGKRNLLSLTSTSFDIFQLETYLPLLTGGCCYFYSKPLTDVVTRIENDIKTNNINLIQATPSAWKIITNHLSKRHKKTDVLIGGENSLPDLIATLRNQFQRIYHVYGPTETTIWSTLIDLTDEATIHLGQPITNTRLLVVDEYNQVVPVGCSGELIISGKSVSEGYVGHDLLNTHKFFMKNYPFLSPHEYRFYRTGDKVRLQHNGKLIYESRLDNQIKLRGYRIELGDIVHALKQFPDVNDAHVIAVQRVETVLVAFVMAHDKINTEKLQLALTLSLPNYMLPQAILVLTEWPLTLNGKINNFKLAQLYEDYLTDTTDLLQRELNPIEKRLQKIWSECLKINDPDSQTSFFNLGGSSLLITELLAEVNRQFQTQITIREFVNQPTIELQAKLITKQQNLQTITT